MTKYFIDKTGRYVGAFDGVDPLNGSIEVPSAPDDARQLWTGNGWGEPVATQGQINAEARAYLAGTDWYGDRQRETGKAIPAGILEARQAARDAVIE